MYIIKNAVKSIMRNKIRNIMISIIALVIAVSACVSLSIREAAETAKENTINNLSVTAQLSFDRTSVMENMQGNPPSEPSDNGETGGGFNRNDIDFSALSDSMLSIDDYLKYTECLSAEDGYYYELTLSLNATGDLLPYGTEEDDESTDSSNDSNIVSFDDNKNSNGTDSDKGFGGKNPIGNMASGDLKIAGYSSYSAILTMFGEDGNYTISSGSMFDETSSDLSCIISDELALYNNLSVGDSVVLANPNYADETYKITISGIYTNSSSSSGNSMFSRSDPANNIYMNSNALQKIVDTSIAAGNTETDENGDTVEVALNTESSFTYFFANVDNYETFKTKAETLGLPENYVISSSDLSAYENSLTPLNTLSTMTGWFFLIVLVIGGIILVVFNMFNIRERKYEVGVLTAIGMKKSKVMAQFICELFIITFAAIIIGSTIGATISVPVTNALLESQIEKSESSTENLNNNFGFEKDKGFGSADSGGFNGGSMPQIGSNKTPDNLNNNKVNYIDSVSSATNLNVILQMILVGALLTIISSMAAMITIMRYEPLQIFSNRS